MHSQGRTTLQRSVAAAEPMYCYRHPDRETMVSCSECGRPICPDCMVYAPVGIRCPDHSGQPQGSQRVTQGLKRASYEGTGALVTKTLIGLNVGIYLLELALGGTSTGPENEIYVKASSSGRSSPTGTGGA